MIAGLLRAWRHHEELSLREAAERIGIPATTYANLEKGTGISGETFAHVMRWLLESDSL